MCLRGRVASFGKRRTVEFSTLRAHGLSSGNSLGFQADRKMNRGASVIRVGGKGDAFGDARVRNDADEHPFDGDSRVVRDENGEGRHGVLCQTRKKKKGGSIALGFTPFLIACQQGHPEVVSLLPADMRIDVNKPTDSGSTPFSDGLCGRSQARGFDALGGTESRCQRTRSGWIHSFLHGLLK